MPLPATWARASTVIQSDASRAARRTSCQVRSGSSRDRALEHAEGEPPRLERRLAEEAIGDEEPRARAIAPRRLAEAALDGLDQRPANADHVTDPGRDPALALEVLRVGERREALVQGAGEGFRVAGQLREAPAERPRLAGLCWATNATARWVTGLVGRSRTAVAPAAGLIEGSPGSRSRSVP